MKIRRVAFVLGALTLVGCHGGGGGSTTSSTIPTTTAVSLDSTQSQSLEPLADGAKWTYQCDSGATPQITTTLFGTVSSVNTFTETSTFTLGRVTSGSAPVVLANDTSGNLSLLGFTQNGVFTQLQNAVVVEAAMPATGATYTLPDQGGGIVTSVFQNTVPLTVPTGTYATAYHFHNTYTKNANYSVDFYDVRGVGTIRLDFNNGVVSDRCLLNSTNVVSST